MNSSFFVKNDADTTTDTWLTPPDILYPLGDFDTDPCAAKDMPWQTAKTMLTKEDDGLSVNWNGRVWLNPPYSNIEPFMSRMAGHNNGIALVFNRTDTEWFQEWVFTYGYSILFIKGRIKFCNSSGIRSKSNGGAGSVLVAYGKENSKILDESGIDGKFLEL